MRRHFFSMSFFVFVLSFSVVYASENREKESRRKAFEQRSEIRSFPKRAWQHAYRHNTLHYAVITNTSPDVGRYLGDIMELTFARYKEIFGAQFLQIPRLPVYAYAQQTEYEQLAVQGQFTSGLTSGFFSPVGDGAIHLPYAKISGIHPRVTLFHEGTHQFVHQAMNFHVPLQLKGLVPKELHILPSVPIWLNEGLATYMETARYDGASLEIGRVNVNRLYYLQQLLRSKAAPSVREVVARRYGQPFGAAHYSVAWGLVYGLRHDWKVAQRDANRRNMTKYLKVCKKGMMALPIADFRKQFIVNEKLPADFMVRWRVHIGEKSLSEFERIIVGRGSTLDAWEKAWTKRMLNLDRRKPYGGTNRGEAVENKGREGIY